MRKHPRAFVVALIAFVSVAGVVRGNAPTTAPIPDTPAGKEIRDTLIEWNTVGPKWSEADLRKLYYTANAKESAHTDSVAREDFEQGKTQKLVRDKWGPEAEARFAHAYGTDTIEDDQTAQITVNGDHATIVWKVPAIEKTAMIKVAGKWLMDVHATFERDLAEDPEPDKDGPKIESLMREAAADITAARFARPGPFLADFEKKYNLLVDDDDD